MTERVGDRSLHIIANATPCRRRKAHAILHCFGAATRVPASPAKLGSMYFLYTSVTIVLFVLLSPYFVYQALRYRKYVTSLRQRLGYLPVSFNVDGEESIWIHAVSVGEALTARALAARAEEALPGAPALRLDDDGGRAAGGVARDRRGRRRLLLPARLPVHRAADAAPGEPAAVHHGGNRDLAEPAAGAAAAPA